MKRLLLLGSLLLLSAGCAVTMPPPELRDMRFFHDENRGNVRFVCWRAPKVSGWQCARTALSWPQEFSDAVCRSKKDLTLKKK